MWSRIGPRMRKALAAALVVVFLLFVAGLAGLAWLHGASGRTWLARVIERGYNAEVQGTLRIYRIDEIRGLGVVATGVAFVDPRGQEVITIREARLGVDLTALLRERLVFTGAHARGVVVRVVPGASHSTSLEDAFAGRPPNTGPGLDLDTNNIRVEEGRTRVAMGGPPVLFNSLAGSLRIVLRPGAKVRLRFDGFRGRFSLPNLEILNSRSFRTVGWIHAGERPILEFRLRACLPRGTVPIRLRFVPGRLSFRFDADENRIAGAILGTVATFSPTITSSRGNVNLAGVPRCGSVSRARADAR
jgi:hypothetical protein